MGHESLPLIYCDDKIQISAIFFHFLLASNHQSAGIDAFIAILVYEYTGL